MNAHITWDHYAGLPGFYGQGSSADIEALNKALSAGSSINYPGAVAGDGFALRPESLDRTLKIVTFRMEHIRLWRDIFKAPAYNTVEEYNQLLSYGSGRSGAFIPEGGMPREADSTYDRKYSVVKFMGTARRVTDVMTMVRPAHGSVVAQETVNGTMFLLEQIERALFTADSSMDPLEFDGFDKLISDNAPATNIIDMRGRPLSEDTLIDGTLTIHDAPNYGKATHIHMNPKVKADFVKSFFPKGRYDLGSLSLGKVGGDIPAFMSPTGDVRLETNTFIDDGGGVSGLAAIGDLLLRPSAPTITTAAAAAGAGSSLFGAADAGQYFYWVVAHNAYGQSAPVQVNAVALTVASADGVTFSVTPGAVPPSYYSVYRTLAGGGASTARFIRRVSNIVSGAPSAAALTITDLNARIPGCTSAFMWQQDQTNMLFKQLAPMVRRPLATIDTSMRWLQLLYGVPQLFTPRRNVIYRNVGRAADYVGAP